MAPIFSNPIKGLDGKFILVERIFGIGGSGIGGEDGGGVESPIFMIVPISLCPWATIGAVLFTK